MNNKFLQYYMDIAERTALLSCCKRKQVGAILVSSDNLTILSYGYNGTINGLPNDCEDANNLTLPTVVHAEINAITKAAKLGYSTKDTTLFVTLSPCINCALAIIQSGIKQIYYKYQYKCIDSFELFKQSNINVIQI